MGLGVWRSIWEGRRDREALRSVRKDMTQLNYKLQQKKGKASCYLEFSAAN